jgi:hypothetical protein
VTAPGDGVAITFERGEYRTLSTAGLTLSAVIFGAFSRIFTLQTSIPAFQHAAAHGGGREEM